MKLKKILFSFLALGVSVLSAQEVISHYSLMDEGGTATASTTNETVAYLTDKDENTAFAIPAGKNSWVQFEFNQPKIVTGYTLVSYDDNTKDPKNWQMLASDNGTDWTVLSSETGVVFDHRYKAMAFSTGLNTSMRAYKFYRLLVYRTSILAADGPLNIAEWQLFGLNAIGKTDITKNGGMITAEYPGLENFNETFVNLTDANAASRYTAPAKTLWVQYESSEPVKLSSYTLTSAASHYSRNPRSWEILGSNDGVNWSVLDAQYNKTFYDIPNNQLRYSLPFTDSRTYNWAEYAAKAQNTLYRTYWNTTGYYFNQEYYPDKDSLHTGYNYWWNAHVMDVLVDAYNRTKSSVFTQRMSALRAGVFAKCASGATNKWWNTFYDDMEWMGLATLRAFEATGDQSWRTATIDLWNMVEKGWTDNVQEGGIMWASGSPNSKNACSNGPAMTHAAKLYKLTGEQKYLDWAKKIYNWMVLKVQDPVTGLIWDGPTNQQLSWTFTYNQGTFMAGCVELYLITNEQKYLDQAMRIADILTNPVATERRFSPGGILTGEGTGDGGLFKGIFMRYLQQFIRYKILDTTRQERYIRYYVQNAKSVWNAATQKPEIAFSNNWMDRLPVTQKRDMSTHVSGTMLFEQLAEMEREGLLNLPHPYAANCEQSYRYIRYNQLLNRGDSNSQLAEIQFFSKDMESALPKIDMQQLPVMIFANSGEIHFVNNDLKKVDFMVFDVSGKQKAAGSFSDKNKTLSSFEAGAYVLQCRVGNTTFAAKVVVE